MKMLYPRGVVVVVVVVVATEDATKVLAVSKE